MVEEEERDDVEVESAHDDGFGDSVSESNGKIGKFALMQEIGGGSCLMFDHLDVGGTISEGNSEPFVESLRFVGGGGDSQLLLSELELH